MGNENSQQTQDNSNVMSVATNIIGSAVNTLMNSNKHKPNKPHNPKLQSLINLGCFEIEKCKDALEKYDDIEIATEYLFANVEWAAMEQKCNGQHCEHLNYLILILNEYNQYKKNNYNYIDYKKNNQQKVLDSFYHLLTAHDTNDEFAKIHENLSKCDIKTCQIFSRNHRDRKQDINLQKLYHTNHIEPISLYQTLDTIHCYYCHSHDIGYRISNKQYVEEKEEKQNNDFFKIRNKSCRRAISCRQKAKIEINSSKFKSLSAYTECTENGKIYQFGRKFGYDGSGEIRVEKKYEHLQEELTQNKICVVNAEQFINESNKAHKKHTSYYRRALYTKLKKEQILSIMFYTNYDSLQTAFTQTYFDGNTHKHCEFYHLGKLLKRSMLSHKEEPFEDKYVSATGKPKTFQLYHGITAQFYFPAYIECNIWSPLSTTTQFGVAQNFTNSQGFIIQFEIDKTNIGVWYLAVDWLSDFANEKEHLFVQSAEGLVISNIVDVKNNLEYSSLLTAIRVLYWVTHCNSWEEDVSDLTKALIPMIVKDVLAKHEHKAYDRWESLSKYAREMLNVCFVNRDRKIGVVEFRLDVIKEKHDYLLDVFFHSNMEWIKMDVINTVFPDSEQFLIRGVTLCAGIFDDILNNYKNMNFSLIRLLAPKWNKFTLKQYRNYKEIFNGFGIKVSSNVDFNLNTVNGWIAMLWS